MWRSLRSSSTMPTSMELSDEECAVLLAAGLRVRKGESPRDLYCFQYIPYFDGTPLQVLRLLEDAAVSKRRRLSFSSDSHVFVTPVKTTTATPRKSVITPTMTTEKRRSTVTIDVDVAAVSLQDERVSPSRKRKSLENSSRTSSPLAALFSPRSIRTPSPGLKTQRSSVLKQFDTPEQNASTGTKTPPTVLAPPKRFSVTLDNDDNLKEAVRFAPQFDAAEDELDVEDGFLDDAHDENDDRACCDVQGVVEPLWDVLQRTSTRFATIWDEVRDYSSSLAILAKAEEELEPSGDADDRDRLVDLLVYNQEVEEENENENENDPDKDETNARLDLIGPWASSSMPPGTGRRTSTSHHRVRTRRQRREIRPLGASFSWRIW